MSAPKNYTIKQMEKESGFAVIVQTYLAKNPQWTIRTAREAAARQMFIQKIRALGTVAA